MTLLTGFKVIQIGGGSAAAVCGRLLADVGAQVTCIDPGAGTMLLACLNRGKAVAATATQRREGLATAHLIVREGQLSFWAYAGSIAIQAKQRARSILRYFIGVSIGKGAMPWGPC